MNQETVVNQITFSISSSKCISFEFTDFAVKNEVSIPFDKYRFSLTFNMDVNASEKLFAINVNSFVEANSEIKGNIAKLDSRHEFIINNFDQVMIKNQEGLSIPDQALATFLSIAVSSLRGMYSVKLESSIYNNVVLPLIDPNQLIPKRAPIIA